MKAPRWVFLYVVTLTNPHAPPLHYFGIHRSWYENHLDDPYMGSPCSFSFLWDDESFTKKRRILTVRPYTEENYYKLRARESLLIVEAWLKYGKLTGAEKLRMQPDIRKALFTLAKQYMVNSLCLNMSSQAPRKNNKGYEIYLTEKQNIDAIKNKLKKPTVQLIPKAPKAKISPKELQRRRDQSARHFQKNQSKKFKGFGRKSNQRVINEMNAADARKMGRAKKIIHERQQYQQARALITEADKRIDEKLESRLTESITPPNKVFHK